MDESIKFLSDVTIYSKYAKYLPEKQRRETWNEIVDRNLNMHLDKFKEQSEEFKKEIKDVYEYVRRKEILPSMRMMQFAGKAIELSPVRGYNCSLVLVDDIVVFSEIMFLLLMGCGVGYSVQKKHVAKLPPLQGPITKKGPKKRHLIDDSIQGWADSIKILMNIYFKGRCDIEFDFRDIRPKGSLLKTSGGKAPGPQPLKDCIHNIKKVLDNAIQDRGRGTKLKPIEVHDINCFIADCVLTGGIRRAACISFFTYNDAEMMSCKTGNWFETNPQRGRANNSVVLLRHREKEEDFKQLWDTIKESRCGEPGFFRTHDSSSLVNPCGESSMIGSQFCNLSEISTLGIKTQEDLNLRAKMAAFIGTLQAAYTDFHYLRDEWQENTENDSLLGVSITGLSDKNFLKLNLKEAAGIVKDENKRVAKIININKASRTTLVKPSGTASCVLGTSSGIHAWHSKYYIRRMRMNKTESLYKYLKKICGELIEDEFFKPDKEAVLSIPIKAPEGAITRNEGAIELLDRIKYVYDNWILGGHRKGINTHCVSATINIKENEWDDVYEWMWKNKESYGGLTVLPHDNTTYKQMPFEEITEKQYNEMIKFVKNIDLTKIVENDDNTSIQSEAACSGGVCTLTRV